MLREVNNYTQQYVADQLDLSQNAYSLIEKGLTKLTLERLEQIAAFYKVDFTDFLTDHPLHGAQKGALQSIHTNFPPAISPLEKMLYEKTIAHLENNINHLYHLIEQLTHAPTSNRQGATHTEAPQTQNTSNINHP